MQGGDLTFSGNSTASVVNYGTIRALEGNIYLIGASVANHGVLQAKNGTVGTGGRTGSEAGRFGASAPGGARQRRFAVERRRAEHRHDQRALRRTGGQRRQRLRAGDQQHGRDPGHRLEGDRRPHLSHRARRHDRQSRRPDRQERRRQRRRGEDRRGDGVGRRLPSVGHARHGERLRPHRRQRRDRRQRADSRQHGESHRRHDRRQRRIRRRHRSTSAAITTVSARFPTRRSQLG